MMLRMIQPIGKRPNAAPSKAVLPAISTGIRNTNTAAASATASPSSADTCAFIRKIPRAPSRTIAGSAAISVESHALLKGVNLTPDHRRLHKLRLVYRAASVRKLAEYGPARHRSISSSSRPAFELTDLDANPLVAKFADRNGCRHSGDP